MSFSRIVFVVVTFGVMLGKFIFWTKSFDFVVY